MLLKLHTVPLSTAWPHEPLSRSTNGEELAFAKCTPWWYFCSISPAKDHHQSYPLLMISCSRAINYISEISRLTQHTWYWAAPPHLVFLSLGIALHHGGWWNSVLPHGSLAGWGFCWVFGFVFVFFFCIFIDSYRHLECCVFLTLFNNFWFKWSY